MKPVVLALVCLSLLGLPTRAQCRERERVTAGEMTIRTIGETRTLRLTDATLEFCDGQGGHRIELGADRGTVSSVPCAKDDGPNGSCSDLGLNIEVRSPPGESDDIVDFDNWSLPMTGRVHDCAAENGTVVIATGTRVVLVDVGKRTDRRVGSGGAERVAVGSGWLVWSDVTGLHLQPLPK